MYEVLDLDDFSDAVARVYDASMDVTRWADALSLLARMFGARASQISVAAGFDPLGFIKISGINDELLGETYAALRSADASRSTHAGLPGRKIQGVIAGKSL